jgi:hypothetical protein
MEWLSTIFSKESVILIISIVILIVIFSFAAKKAYSTHLLKMKKIQTLFDNKQDKF